MSAKSGAVCSGRQSCRGVARPSSATAVASTQISLAPDGAKKRTQVFAETDAQVLPPALGVDVGQRMELEVAGHVAPTQSWNGRSVPVRFNVKTTASLESTPWD